MFLARAELIDHIWDEFGEKLLDLRTHVFNVPLLVDDVGSNQTSF
jgi:hypothetical protein